MPEIATASGFFVPDAWRLSGSDWRERRRVLIRPPFVKAARHYPLGRGWPGLTSPLVRTGKTGLRAS